MLTFLFYLPAFVSLSLLLLFIPNNIRGSYGNLMPLVFRKFLHDRQMDRFYSI